MAEPDAKTRVHKAIQDDVLRVAPKATDVKNAITVLTQAMMKVDQAAKKGIDPDLLGTYRRELGAQMRAVGSLALKIGESLAQLKQIAADEDDFEADAKEIEAVQASLTQLKASLTDWIVKAKKVDDRAKGEEAQGEKSEKVAHREWDLLLNEYDQLDKTIASNLKFFRDQYQKAAAAAKARDRAALEEHRGLVVPGGVSADALNGKALARDVDDFAKKYDLSSFSKEFRDEVANDRRTTVLEINKRLQSVEQEAKKLMDAAAKLEIAPADYVKATAKLGFKANFNSRVEKALKLDPPRLIKELEAIGKDAHVKGTGKEFFEILKKEKFYP